MQCRETYKRCPLLETGLAYAAHLHTLQISLILDTPQNCHFPAVIINYLLGIWGWNFTDTFWRPILHHTVKMFPKILLLWALLGLTCFLGGYSLALAGRSVSSAVISPHLDEVMWVGLHVVETRVVFSTGNQNTLRRRLVLHRLPPEPDLRENRPEIHTRLYFLFRFSIGLYFY